MENLNRELLHFTKIGDLNEVKRLIEAGADFNARYDWGFTALLWASKRGHLEIVKFLENNKKSLIQKISDYLFNRRSNKRFKQMKKYQSKL